MPRALNQENTVLCCQSEWQLHKQIQVLGAKMSGEGQRVAGT